MLSERGCAPFVQLHLAVNFSIIISRWSVGDSGVYLLRRSGEWLAIPGPPRLPEGASYSAGYEIYNFSIIELLNSSH